MQQHQRLNNAYHHSSDAAARIAQQYSPNQVDKHRLTLITFSSYTQCLINQREQSTQLSLLRTLIAVSRRRLCAIRSSIRDGQMRINDTVHLTIIYFKFFDWQHTYTHE